MNILIVGKGNVGSTLGKRFSEDPSHAVKYAVTSPKGGDESTIAESAGWADLIILAIPFGAVAEVCSQLATHGPKMVIDATNPINADFSGIALPGSNSGGEFVGGHLPECQVVKAFNTIGFDVMANPSFAMGRPWLPICSNHPEALETVAQLAESIGFDPAPYPKLAYARETEAFAWLWITLSFKSGSRDFAFVKAEKN